MSAVQRLVAREKLMQVALRRLSSERDEPNAHFDDELEYCDDLLVEAARELVEAVDGEQIEIAV